ncbi:hypothetical protein EBA01_19015 [Xanthomonas oryzae pv. oryzae]|nr:hypothetical protein BVV16_19375 [Xanthomonas oryzae pv. oryzae]AUI95480.1 hypothetical protein BVV17_19405 [Xanthomonas oryzae pv. oryzae]AUI99152.1 hypothetical protein BVV18_19405 [Xanthomonas oryzae pv. oryzae]AUJ02827.1 hypothetical protein BVV10_19370 [Xanthomonas oryzae pv. oryzae]AUJ06496.1 hypothetical protein BVV19_19450 [Xanthomonas oryzae pv. oryzae]
MKERPHVRHRILRRTTTRLPDHTVLHQVMKPQHCLARPSTTATRQACCDSVQTAGAGYAEGRRQAQ